MHCSRNKQKAKEIKNSLAGWPTVHIEGPRQGETQVIKSQVKSVIHSQLALHVTVCVNVIGK